MPPVPLLKARTIRKHTRTDQSKDKIRSWARRKMRFSKPLLRKIRSKTRASIALALSDDNLPVWIGQSRQRRYVIRDSVGKEVHIQYTTPVRQTTSPESKEHKHYSYRLVEPDHHLVEETEELLKLWAAIPGHVSTKGATLPPKPSDPAQRLLVSNADSVTPEPASDTFPFTDNAVLPGSNLPYVPAPGGVASNFLKASPNDSYRFGDWPATKSILNNISVDHSLRSPPSVKARGLHTGTDVKQQVESQPISPTEADSALLLPRISEVGIRKHLRLWQELQSKDSIQASPATSSSVIQPTEDDAGSIIEISSDSLYDDCEHSDAPGIDQEGELDDESFLRSGDVVDISTKSTSMLAVFTRMVGNQAQFYNVQGKWLHRPIQRVFHTIPRMFSLEELEPLLPYLPNEEVHNDALDKLHVMDASIPRSVGANLLMKLQSFHQASAEIYRDHLGRIDRVHSLVAHECQRRELSLREITSIVLQKPDVDNLTEVELYTVHKILIKDPKFRPQVMSKHRTYPIWKINPLVQIRNYEKVKEWLREHLEVVITQATYSKDVSNSTYQNKDSAHLNPVSRFVRKARNLIQESRMHRKVTTYGSMGPSDQTAIPEPANADAVVSVSTLVAFDPEERIIIEYLKDWVLFNHIPRIGSTWSLSPMLLRAVGMYEGYDLTLSTGSLLLRELGVIAPWENEGLYALQVRLPRKQDPQILQLWENASNSVKTIVQPDAHIQDLLEDLRTDWGSLNVYCIDAAGAREIDDGVSVETINGQDSMFWIHVHVANPTASIIPGSAVAQYAETLLQTHYFPEKVYPMLHSDLTQRHFSLAKGRPVLTFSAKMTTDGEFLATKVTPGWVRRIKHITPDRIRRELGFNAGGLPNVSHTLTVGQRVASERHDDSEDTPLSTSEISELRLLHRLGAARRSQRSNFAMTELAFVNEIPRPEVFLQRDGMGSAYSPECARRFIGDPTISWEAREAKLDGDVRQDDVDMFVTELMIMAGEIAARWCGERNIPIPYRGTIRNPALITTPEAYRAQVVDPVMDEMGYVPKVYRRAYNLLIGHTKLRSSPFRHALVDVPAYTKATSPLRRYPDMVVHWQIQAALRHEARLGDGVLVGSTDDSYLPFSRADVDALLPSIAINEAGYRGAASWSTTHWVMQLLHRAFEYRQAPLPSVFDVQVHTEKVMLQHVNGETIGYVKQLSGIDADLLSNDVSSGHGGFRIGDWWQARIERVETYRGRLKMTPIRLIQRVSEDIARYQTGAAYRLFQSASKE
ncbi:MAG: hypothetical protein Q9215_002225 [Flavoplaca cf. flavocitrina]